jgi:broad specificity phosphatase PhoE
VPQTRPHFAKAGETQGRRRNLAGILEDCRLREAAGGARLDAIGPGNGCGVVDELILARHGESVGNVAAAAAHAAGAEEIVLRHRDPDVPLSLLRLDQAQALGLGFTPLMDDQSVAVWSSPYVRAVQTAQIAVASSGRDLPIICDERLRDRELGVLDLLTREDVARRFPLEARRRQWWGKFYHRPPGGESWADVALRLRSFLADLLVIGGAARTPGADQLSGLAALRSGAGQLRMAVA